MTRALLAVAAMIGRAFESALLACRHPLFRELAAERLRRRRAEEQAEILRTRLARLEPSHRPRYRPDERLAILGYRARYGLSVEGTARLFLVSLHTILNWLRDVRRGVERLVKTREPMNKLPDLVREVAARLKFEWLSWGSRRIAGFLARLGLRSSRTSVQRMLRRPPPPPRKLLRAPKAGWIEAKAAGHLWFVDFTRVRSFLREVVIGAVVDGFSRKVLATRACAGEPTAAFACTLVGRAVAMHGKPRWIVTDQGTQFTSGRFTRFLACRKIRRRFGAVGSSQSVTTIERFWKSLKREAGSGLLVWLPLSAIERKLSRYRLWFNSERVHQGLGFRTPDDAWFGRAARKPRRVLRAVLEVRLVGGDPDLPCLRLRAAA